MTGEIPAAPRQQVIAIKQAALESLGVYLDGDEQLAQDFLAWYACVGSKQARATARRWIDVENDLIWDDPDAYPEEVWRWAALYSVQHQPWKGAPTDVHDALEQLRARAAWLRSPEYRAQFPG